jgi:hypothetical protein
LHSPLFVLLLSLSHLLLPHHQHRQSSDNWCEILSKKHSTANQT